MTGNLTIVDKKTQFGTFRYEERIKSFQFRENIDYTFDEIKGIYDIISLQLRKDILIIQNPYNENIDVSDLTIKVLVDYRGEINIKPQIVIDLEKRENLVEASRGRNNFPQSLPPSSESKIKFVKDEKKRKQINSNQHLFEKVKKNIKNFVIQNLVSIDTKERSTWLIDKSAKYDKGRLINFPEMHNKEKFSKEQWNKIVRIIDNGERSTKIGSVVSESQGFSNYSQQNLAIAESWNSQQNLPKSDNSVIIGFSVIAFSAVFGGIYSVIKWKKDRL